MYRPPNVAPRVGRLTIGGAVGFIAGVGLAAGAAKAQSASASLSPYTAGYGGVGLGGLSSPVSPNLINTQTPYSTSDAVNPAGAASSSTSGGAGQSYSGVGQAADSRDRAPTQTSTQTRPAAPSASASTAAPTDGVLNGKIDLDGGQ
jgi:hypothetical protein